MPSSQYEIPKYGLPEGHTLGWLLEAVQEGQAWLNAQAPVRQWESALQALSNMDLSSPLAGMSNTRYPKVKRIARELVASLGNFRHEGEIKTVWDQRLYDNAHMLTNLDRSWYKRTTAHAAHRRALQYAVATGTAYFWERWDPMYHGPTRGDVRLDALSPQNVTFIQLPNDHDIQNAYAVIIREELPLNLAKRIYGRTNPGFAANLQPDRAQPGWIAKGLQKVQQFVSPALRVAGRMQQNRGDAFPTVDIFHMYTLDSSCNEGPVPVEMGASNTNWSYTVPAVGDELPTAEAGRTKKATAQDAILFPLRRYTIYARTGICYDGSAPNWHGDAPITRLRFSDWAWEALGGSQVTDLISMEKGIEALMRSIEDSMAARLDPPYLYDDNIVARDWAMAFNPRKAGARAAAPLNAGKAIDFPIDPAIYNVPDAIPSWIEAQEGRMDYISAVRDLVAVAKARQIPSSDTLEKLLEMAGPIVQDMVRSVEEPLRDLGKWRIAYYYQFYTRARMITTSGPEGVDLDVQYYPEALLPYLMRQNDQGVWERAESEAAHLTRLGALSTSEIRYERMRAIEQFEYSVTESGINEINRMSQLLLYVQLAKSGVLPISWWTMAKAAKVPNYGPPPLGTNTEMERVVAQKRMEAEQEIELAQRLAEAQGQVGAGEGAAPGGARPAPQEGPGRPPTFQRPPRLVNKPGEGRSTIATS